MSAQRTAFDCQENILEGRTVEEAREEAARLAAKALAITDHLALTHYAPQSIVRQNLEAERDGYEWEAAGIEARIAEHEGKIVKLRELPVPLSPRARRVREAAR